MRTVFVDTNYFLRFLLADVDGQHKRAKKLFEQGLAGKVKLVTSVVVFFEIYWVLSSFYGKRKGEVVGLLGDLLKLSFIDWEVRQRLVRVVELYDDLGVDFEDAYNLVFTKEKKIGEMASFDKKLVRAFSGC